MVFTVGAMLWVHADKKPALTPVRQRVYCGVSVLCCVIMIAANMHSTSERIVITSVVLPTTSSQADAVLLAASIRDYAGALAHVPIWFFVPQYGEQLTTATRNKLDSLNVKLIPLELDPEVLTFPLAYYPLIAAAAESLTKNTTEFLVWLGTNTIVLQEPGAFILPDDKAIGYRPVHHTNVGVPLSEPLDAFWTLIYAYCDVPEDRIFPMRTHVDDQTIRPYFNAGCLITRPEKGLFEAWRNTFFAIYRENSFQELYQNDRRYAIFIHQAVLSGIILRMFRLDEMYELPLEYNYPMHLHAEDVTAHRPTALEECITVRHEGFYKDSSWSDNMPAGEPLKQWLAQHLPVP
jgi:hypothetical protein